MQKKLLRYYQPQWLQQQQASRVNDNFKKLEVTHQNSYHTCCTRRTLGPSDFRAKTNYETDMVKCTRGEALTGRIKPE